MAVAVTAEYGTVAGRLLRTWFPLSETVAIGEPIKKARVIFTPSIPRSTSSTEVFIADQVIAYTDEDGYLCNEDGSRGINLLATDSTTLSHKDWTWKVVVSAPSINSIAWSIQVPKGVVTDLATAIPLPENMGDEVTQWEQLKVDVIAAVAEAQESATNASNSASSASTSATSAASSKNSAETASSNATTQATLASTKATAAANSATAAANSATAAANSATQAETSKTSAASSATSASTSATTAQSLVQQAEFLLDNRGTVSGTLDLSGLTQQSFVHATLTGNVTVTLPAAPVVGMTVTLELKQDSTGGRTLTIKNAVASFGVAITLSTAANALDEVHCVWDGVRWKARVGGLSDSIPTSWVV